MMKVAIIHYHLQRGGVTTVIENAVEALEGIGVDCAVIGGLPYIGTRLKKHACVEGLQYCQKSRINGSTLGGELKSVAKRLLGSAPDIWHIHNHSLGKNIVFPELIKTLAQAGERLYLQMHDFAEDGRPQNYQLLREGLIAAGVHSPYPIRGNIHYAVINSRDAGYLKAAGMPDDVLSIIPNAIVGKELPEDLRDPLPGTRKRLLLYPTRGIRRKNMGELLLLSMLMDDGNTVLASTLPPDNPLWHPIYEHWESLVKELKIPVLFGVGTRPDTRFEDWIGRSECLLTTSIQEGFGLAYLEPWLFGKPLAGRNLPDITEDFSGIDLSNLYTQIPIPRKLLSKNFAEKVEYALTRYYESFKLRLPQGAVNAFMSTKAPPESIDFGALDEAEQERIIRAIYRDPELKTTLPCIKTDIPPAIIARNRTVTTETYNLEQYAKRLLRDYRHLLSSSADKLGAPIAPIKLLSCFLNPQTFRFLKS
ncbi:MAG: glycosyltransferase family 4 protein [Opitutales bacterium]|nr:glycosyltransferase family 4 protein [Opitutales bacterium]